MHKFISIGIKRNDSGNELDNFLAKKKKTKTKSKRAAQILIRASALSLCAQPLRHKYLMIMMIWPGGSNSGSLVVVPGIAALILAFGLAPALGLASI